MTRVRLGTQGWSYDDWVGNFYAGGTRADRFLARYAEEFDTVEIDSTWYGTPDRRRIAKWRSGVPAGFEFSLKMPREITHERRMVNVRELMREFYDNVRGLGPALGCVLIQFEASFGRACEPDLLRALEDVPGDVRTAVEFRDPAWYDAGAGGGVDVQRFLNERGMPLAVADSPYVPRAALAAAMRRDAAPFGYLRWIGDHDAVARYDRVQIERGDALRWWGGEVAREAQARRVVYGYVNNHYQGHSPATVRALYASAGMPHVIPGGPEQTSLF